MMLLTYMMMGSSPSESKLMGADEDGMSATKMFMRFLSLLIVVTAVIVSVTCNKNPIYWVLALIFPEIYLIIFAVKKFILKTDGYCPQIPDHWPRKTPEAKPQGW
jgi:hypothetical protein